MQQATAQSPQAPAPPAGKAVLAPAQPAPPAVPLFAGRDIVGAPTSRAELQALQSQRTELSNQLSSATGRRRDVANQLVGATGANAEGLTARLKVLDARIAQIERDIDVTGQQIAAAPPRLLTSSAQDITKFGGLSSGQVTGISIVSILAFGLPMVITAGLLILRRSARRTPQSQLSPELSQRLDNLERGMEAIAIEIERVSEGQRFTTKLLSGAAPTYGTREREAERVPRDR